MKYPQYFIQQEPSHTSPLHWDKKHPKIGLTEILCSLDVLGSFVTSDGSKASFTLIVKCFEKFLNVKLGEPQEAKRAVFDRKLNLTKYTDACKNALIKHSEYTYR